MECAPTGTWQLAPTCVTACCLVQRVVGIRQPILAHIRKHHTQCPHHLQMTRIPLPHLVMTSHPRITCNPGLDHTHCPAHTPPVWPLPSCPFAYDPCMRRSMHRSSGPCLKRHRSVFKLQFLQEMSSWQYSRPPVIRMSWSYALQRHHDKHGASTGRPHHGYYHRGGTVPPVPPVRYTSVLCTTPAATVHTATCAVSDRVG